MYILKINDERFKFYSFRNELKKTLNNSKKISDEMIELKLPQDENKCREIYINALKRENKECELLEIMNFNGIQTELVLYKK